MIDGLQPYPAVKESGLPWLGSVPAHWEIGSFGRFLARVEQGWSPLATNGQPEEDQWAVLSLSAVRRGVFFRSAIKPVARIANVPPNLELKNGDLLLTRSNTRDRVGDVCVVKDVRPKTFMSDLIYRLSVRQRSMHSGYAMYYLLSNYGRWQVERDARGSSDTMPKINQRHIKSWNVVAPPLDEQRLIVRFLDWHGAQTAKLIRTKKKIIALLDEQKQETIHRAVTRGLDPTTSFKLSGVPWLGNAPEGWEVKKLKQLARFNNGVAFKPSDWSYSGKPIIRIQNLNGSENFNYTTKIDIPQEMHVKKGDILFAWSGNVGTSFGPFIWNRDFSGYLNQHIFKVEKINLHRRYFYYVLKAVTKHVEENTHGIIGLVHITKPHLGSISVPIAPSHDQAVIACWLDDSLKGLDTLIRRVQREIVLIQELRTRLISDVVTGKLDVRAVAPKLPEVTEDPLDVLIEDNEPDALSNDPEDDEAAA